MGRLAVHIDAEVWALRLTGIEFDANTLRLVAEVGGTAKADVTNCGRRAATGHWPNKPVADRTTSCRTVLIDVPRLFGGASIDAR